MCIAGIKVIGQKRREIGKMSESWQDWKKARVVNTSVLKRWLRWSPAETESFLEVFLGRAIFENLFLRITLVATFMNMTFKNFILRENLKVLFPRRYIGFMYLRNGRKFQEDT